MKSNSLGIKLANGGQTMNQAQNIVLYAEDDLDDQLLMREAVEQLDSNYELMVTNNGKELLELLEELSLKSSVPCLIALDGNMPLLNGKQTVTEIFKSNKWSNIPICIFSTSPAERFTDIADEYGVKVFTKPTTITEYQDVVRQIIDHCHT